MYFSGICPAHGTRLVTDGCSGLLYCDSCQNPVQCLNVMYTNNQGRQITVLIKEASQIEMNLVTTAKKVVEEVQVKSQAEAEEIQLQKCRDCTVYWNMFSTYTILTFILACCILLLSVLVYKENKTVVVAPAEKLNRN